MRGEEILFQEGGEITFGKILLGLTTSRFHASGASRSSSQPIINWHWVVTHRIERVMLDTRK